ncbi:hypothetical protein [Cetobacterium sp.]|uniref:hypothetical protein n=1 Tax=Cetobacterium sp. TaxID=2071632 RepID=UPI003F3C2F3E
MKVLSIDIDFLFTGMNEIQKYFDVDLSPIRSWKVVNWKSKGTKYLPCQDSADWLDNLLKIKIKKDTKVFLIEEHDGIIKVLRENKCDKVDMFNIDYHNDISYGNEDEELNLENWVQFARKENLIKNYNWICQDDSKVCKDSPIFHNFCSWKDVNLELIPEFDIIVLCTSKHFTPPKYWGLCERISKDINYRIEKLIF